MVKKILLNLLLCLSFCQLAIAEPVKISEVVEKLPPLRQGVAFSLVDNNWNYSSTMEVLKWKFIGVDVGYAGAAENTKHKLIGDVSFDLLKLSNFGIEFPILKYVEVRPYVWFGVGNIQVYDVPDTETDWGVGCSILSVKF